MCNFNYSEAHHWQNQDLITLNNSSEALSCVHPSNLQPWAKGHTEGYVMCTLIRWISANISHLGIYWDKSLHPLYMEWLRRAWAWICNSFSEKFIVYFEYLWGDLTAANIWQQYFSSFLMQENWTSVSKRGACGITKPNHNWPDVVLMIYTYQEYHLSISRPNIQYWQEFLLKKGCSWCIWVWNCYFSLWVKGCLVQWSLWWRQARQDNFSHGRRPKRKNSSRKACYRG